MKAAVIALKSIIKGIDPIDVEAENAWSTWNKAVEEHRKNPTIASQRKVRESVIRLHLSIGHRTRRESERKVADADQKLKDGIGKAFDAVPPRSNFSNC